LCVAATRGGRGVDAHDEAIAQPFGEIDGDGPWANADVKQSGAGFQPGRRYAAEFVAVRHR
jgi:hypothetical protein